MASRKANERKFTTWTDQPDGGRRYWYNVSGSWRWTARYVKELNAQERILAFRQEIYDEQERLVELHEKFPIDTGHKRMDATRR